MGRSRVAFLVLAGFLMLTACSQASDVDRVLARAKQDGKAVMLELGSVGCIPCEQMKPVMERMRVSFRDRLEVLFIDVRQDAGAGRRFGVHMIPTQVFLDRDGKEFHRHIGYYSYEEIVTVLGARGMSEAR